MKSSNFDLKSNQRKYLRSIAHKLKPVVQVGQKGITETVVKAVAEALEHHELIKIKFIEDKDKASKQAMLTTLLERSPGIHHVGMIGHTVILYKENPDPEKRSIVLPD